MGILKTLQRLEAATDRCSRGWMFLKCWEILKDYQSVGNHLKILKERMFDKVACSLTTTLLKEN